MKKIYKLIIFVFLISSIFAQQLPKNYSVTQKLKKISDNNPEGNSVNDFALTSDIIWLKTNAGLSKSTDNGDTWTNIPEKDLKENESVFFIEYNDGIMWVSMGHTENINNSDELIGGGFVYSSDNGASWNSLEQPIDQQGDSIITYGNNKLKALPITKTGQNITFDLEYSDGVIWTASWGGGLRKSSDMGQTWERVVLPPDDIHEIKPSDELDFEIDGRKNNNHLLFAVEVIGKDTILAGTANGLNLSIDGGISWKKFNRQSQQNGIIGNWVRNISYNPIDKSIWLSCRFASGTGEKQGVSVSYDLGETWTNFLEGYDASAIGFKETDVIVPTKGDGLLRSSDNGTTWIEVGKITDSDSYISLNTKNFNVVSSIKRNDSSYDIWIGTDRGVTKINETGGSWEGDWKVYFETGEEKSSYAFPNPFNPNKSVVNIKYFLINQSAEVTIRIMDFGMNLVKTVIQNVERNNTGEKIETWDGRDDDGSIVPNGVYFYRIDMGQDDPVFGKILIVR